MTIYYRPGDIGLTSVGEIEWRDESYEFDLTAVFKDAAGTLYWGDDSGCSCPSPFEDFHKLDDFETGTFFDLAAHLSGKLAETWTNDAHAGPQVVDLLARLR